MTKETVIPVQLELELCEPAHRPASLIVREMMRKLTLYQREEREYDEFLRNKVYASLTSRQTDRNRCNEQVGATFAARRADLIGTVTTR